MVDSVSVELEAEPHVTKSVATISGPVNGTLDPRAIPGAVVEYTIQVANEGAGPVDADTLSVGDAIPVQGALFVGDLSGSGSGPIEFSDGAISSGLSLLVRGSRVVGRRRRVLERRGATWSYVPVPDGAGFDGAVTHLRVRPTGTFAAGTLAGMPSFQLRFRMRID